MVQNKKLVDELKKYNNALEKHFTNLDFDSISGLSRGNNINENDEFYSLIATSIMDTKTEMALMRKNLSVEIEGMVSRMIANEQQNFIEQMNKFYGKIIFELKENLNSHVKEINSDVVELRRDINEISRRNTDFTKTIENFGKEIYDFKQALVSLEELSLRNSNSKELQSKFNLLDDKLDKVLTEFAKKNNSAEQNIHNLNKKLGKVETNVLQAEEMLINQKTLLEKELSFNKKEFSVANDKFREVENFLLKIGDLSQKQNLNLSKINEKLSQNEIHLLNQKSFVEKEVITNKSELGNVNKKFREVENMLFKLENLSVKQNKFEDFSVKQNQNLSQIQNKIIETETLLNNKHELLEKNITQNKSNFIEIEKKLQNLENSSSNLKKDFIEQNIDSNKIKLDSKSNLGNKEKKIIINSSNLNFGDSSENFEEIKSETLFLKENSIKTKKDKLDKTEDILESELKVKLIQKPSKIDSKISRILEIDKRLEKLNSLR